MSKATKIIAGAAAAAAATGLAAVAAKKMSTPKVVYHVSADGDEWVVMAEGAKRATSRHDTKKEAVSAARDLAKARMPSRLIIHKQDGEIQRSHDYAPA